MAPTFCLMAADVTLIPEAWLDIHLALWLLLKAFRMVWRSEAELPVEQLVTSRLRLMAADVISILEVAQLQFAPLVAAKLRVLAAPVGDHGCSARRRAGSFAAACIS